MTLLRRIVRGRMLSVLLLPVLVWLSSTLWLSLVLVLLLFLGALFLLLVLVPLLLLGFLLRSPVVTLWWFVSIWLLLFTLHLLVLFRGLSLLVFVLLCIRWSYGSQKKQQHSRADNSQWFHACYLQFRLFFWP